MNKLRVLFLLFLLIAGISSGVYATDNPCTGFTTYTQGLWGNKCSQPDFATVFPSGLTIGCNNKLKLTSAQAVIDFLPSGSTAAALPAGSLTNPGQSYKNVLAGQLVALTLNTQYDLVLPNFSSNTAHLVDLYIGSGPFAGWTVGAFLAEANKKIGGCTTAYAFTLADYNATATAINENYDNGTTNNGYLYCKLQLSIAITAQIVCNGANTGAISSTVTGGKAPFTYSWSNGATTANISGLVAGTYTLTVTDALGQTATTSATITQPTAVVVTTSSTNVNCFGGNTGTASATASGGTAPYTYLWSNGATTSSITGLVAGTYTLTVTDAKGCKKTASVVITQPSAIVATITSTNVNCFGENTGSATVTATGGTAPYTYLWSNGVTSATVTNLVAGTYSVIVTDAKGCKANTTVTISQPSLFSVMDSTSNVSCYGGNNGSAIAMAFGGTAPYTYQWSNGATTPSTSGLAAGTYIVFVKDANGCFADDSVTITQPELLVLSDSTSNVSCYGEANGSAVVFASGGTAPYTYAWSNGDTTASTSGLAAGTYSVVVMDANGCAATDSITITQPELLVLSDSSSNVSCYGGTNGSAVVFASGGTAPYTYAWSNGDTTASTSGLAAGTYSVVVMDANGCAAADSITITQPELLVLSDSSSNVSCYGGANGSAVVIALGGTAPYTYAWNNGATTASTSGLAAGTYSVVVTDANGCAAADSITITQPELLVLSDSSSNVSCYGEANGSAVVFASGGTAPYTYAWNNGDTTASTSGLAAGTYSVVVTDANGCTVADSITITQPELLVVTDSTFDVSCNGGNNGSAIVIASGGTAPYFYLWNNGSTFESATDLEAGFYTVVIADAHGCVTRDTVEILEPALLVLSDSTTNVSCNGATDGSAVVFATGGTSPYTYAWSNGDSTATTSGLAAGTYSVVVTDAHGCTAVDSVTITQPETLVLSDSSTNVSCNGGNNGSASVFVSGGTSPYTYAWSNGATTANVDSLSAGVYLVIVTDANGCSTSDSLTITQPAKLVISASSTDVTCNGGSDGTASAVASGGTAPYTYAWSTGDSTDFIFGLPAGEYSVFVSDANGCFAMDTLNISQPDSVVAQAFSTSVSCNGGNNGTASVLSWGGKMPHSYLWNNGATTQNITGLTSGVYSVTVTDANGCGRIAQVPTIGQPDSLTVSATSTDVSCFGGNDGTASLTIAGGVAPYSILWSNGATTPTITGLTAGIYTFSVNDASGCNNASQVPVDQPTILAASAPKVNITCFGAQNGSASLNITGGTAPYSIAWSNGATTPSISNLVVGPYSVIVHDGKGCTVGLSFNITEPAPLSVGITSVDVTCIGGTGTATAIVTGGTAPYTYNWVGTGQNSPTAILPVGTYTVIVTDANGCPASATITINQLPTTGFTTVTQGGYGSTCNGNNWGCYRDGNFATAFPYGLTIGSCGRHVKFTSSSAIMAFLPSSGTSAALSPGTLTNPDKKTLKNTLAGQATALSLSIGFDLADPNFSSNTVNLQDLIIVSGPFQGFTVGQVLAEANLTLGNCGTYSASSLTSVLDAINQNFDGGTTNNGFLSLPCDIGGGGGGRISSNPFSAPTYADELSTLSAYPNPTVENSTIEFSSTYASHGIVEVYNNATGQLVATLYNGEMGAGNTYSITLNTDKMISGIYVVKMLTDFSVQTKQLVITK